MFFLAFDSAVKSAKRGLLSVCHHGSVRLRGYNLGHDAGILGLSPCCSNNDLIYALNMFSLCSIANVSAGKCAKKCTGGQPVPIAQWDWILLYIMLEFWVRVPWETLLSFLMVSKIVLMFWQSLLVLGNVQKKYCCQPAPMA